MKKIICLAGIFASQLAVAQAVVEKRIPFVFLNQYFSYEILDSDKMLLSDKTLDFKNLTFDTQKKNVSVNLTYFAGLGFGNYNLVLKDSDQKVLANKQLAINTPQSLGVRNFNVPANVAYACIQSASLSTHLEICKNSDAVRSDSKGAKVDSQSVENVGIVVLKDVDKPISFEARMSPTNSVNLITKKRIFYPKNIVKDAQTSVLNIKFADNQLPAGKNTWDEKIDVSQTTITVPKDTILNLQQDIYFTKPDMQNVAVTYSAPEPKVKPKAEVAKSKVEVKKPEPVYMIPKTQFHLEPLLVFSGYKGENSTISATLASDLGKGFSFTYLDKMDDAKDLVAHAMAYQTGISGDVNQTTINNSTQLLYAVGGGIRYRLTDSFGVIPEVELQQDLFFKNTAGTTQIDMVSGLNKQININPYWIFYSSKYQQASLDLGFSYILPTSAGGLSVKSGYKYKYGLSYQYKLPTSAILLGFQTGSRKQDYDDVKFSESFIFMRAGYSIYFE